MSNWDCPEAERRRSGESPTKSHKNGEGTGASDRCGKAEGAGPAQPGEEVVWWWS